MNPYAEKLDFTGRNVIVTGALSGAGRAIAEVFIESGANVILTYNRSGSAADELRAKYPDRNLRFYRLDQSDMASIQTFVEALTADLDADSRAAIEGLTEDPDEITEDLSAEPSGGPRIDCLVNNAGIYPAKATDQIEPDDWDAMLDTNTKGVFFLSKAIRPLIRDGAIVNISSINATNPARMLAHYGASKAAVEMLTRSMAQSFGPTVRVNCVAPGLIYKEGQDEFIPGWTDSYRERSPLHKLVQAEEIGKTCLFLASDLASAVTGQVLTVDCGVLLAPAFFNEL